MTMQAHPSVGMAPTAPEERLAVVDTLRGFALFGVLLVNITMAGQPVYAVATSASSWEAPIDRVAEWVVRAFAEGKFYPLFAFLFGYGFALQMARVQARGGHFGWLYARRLLVLLGIGLVHAFLIWSGDILTVYALLGLVLLLVFRDRQPRTLLVWVAVCMLAPIVVSALLLGLVLLARSQPGGAEQVTAALAQQSATLSNATAASLRAYSQGTWAEVQAARISDTLFLLGSMPLYLMPNALAMFLLGSWSARQGVLRDVAAHVTLLRRLRTWGLSVGLLAGVAYAWSMTISSRAAPSLETLLGTAAVVVGGPLLGLGYGAALVLVVHEHSAWRARLARVAAAGRMALTNYLLQSLTFTTVYYSYGLGLYGELGPAAALVLAIGIYATELALSAWWLRHHAFGPVEWLWRSLTYGHPQPMRVAPGRPGGAPLSGAAASS
jgi:uncharacterized protein